MYQYTVSQWVLIFFWYCFLGWIWECCYVSTVQAYKKKKFTWINRGFLNGPLIPIYGFAALSILLATIPMKESLILIFIMGALAATVMELVTGSLMERIFRVKYWDYSHLPLNYRGYISLFTSLFWGFLATILVRVIHVPMERILLRCPAIVSEIIALILVAAFMFDFNESLRAALDMRELLEKASEYKAEIQRLEKRIDAIVAFVAVPQIQEAREKRETARASLLGRIDHSREKLAERMEQLKKKKDILYDPSNRQNRRIRLHLKHNRITGSGRYKDALAELKEYLEERKS